MLSCELCCSFRALRLLCLILLQWSSLKKPFFSLKCSVLGGLGFIFGCPLRSCPARRQTSHCLPADSPPCCCVVRPVVQALFCCVLHYTLWQSRSVVAGCLGNGGLRQQWTCITVGTGCLGNGWLHQQWACIPLGQVASVMMDAPPPQSVSGRLNGDRLKSRFCSSHWATPTALSLQSPGLAHCPCLAQSQVQPSQVSGCQFNRAPGQVRPVGSAGQGWLPPPRLPASPGSSAWRPTSPLHLGISPFRGQQRLVWKCSSDSPFANSTRAPILGCSHSAILSPLALMLFNILLI